MLLVFCGHENTGLPELLTVGSLYEEAIMEKKNAYQDYQIVQGYPWFDNSQKFWHHYPVSLLQVLQTRDRRKRQS